MIKNHKLGLERFRGSALDIAIWSLKLHDFEVFGLTIPDPEIDPCSNVWGYFGGIAERLNWLAIPPKAADELHKPKQCWRWLWLGKPAIAVGERTLDHEIEMQAVPCGKGFGITRMYADMVERERASFHDVSPSAVK